MGGYISPLYRELQEETSKLEKEFNRYAKSYIFPAHEQLIAYTESEIKALYHKKVESKSNSNWLFSAAADPTRLDQIAFITKLRNDLNNDLSSNDSVRRKKAERTLFGAVLHRHLRLRVSYEEGLVGYVSSYVTNINYCALNNALVELFDLGSLDDYTIYTCCSAAWGYLQQESSKNRYAYINKKNDFFDNFEDIITKAEPKAAPIKAQIDSIYFIQSMAKTLAESDDEIVDKCFEPLERLVTSKLQAIKQGDCYLTRNDILACLKEINASQRTYKVFADLLPERFIISKNGDAYSPGKDGEMENDGNFIDAITKLLIAQSKYTLIGAYLFCLSQCTLEMPHLDSAIRNAIKESSTNVLDIQTYNSAFEQLKKFMDREATADVDFSAWQTKEKQGQEKMIRKLMDVKDEYAKKPISQEGDSIQFVVV
ncbi:hypothetical protein BN59_02921 [Legionella massiliensis]|uniref:Substrate of the Dot/Icm secretion system n=1 Tax=Legionella massiliensis TaxID=1034943 RepID=A0A078L0C5_9GAMM|nr:hypothetical protein [Legionella massiliensis]CDZ78611.1 hypothetical protein BN59_02921 [Legionella massiliensis]CEE14349.1 hypothetical protein BN1094_02921 [Legionella massiliensis]